jgi:alpha-tubulin suppressor-like RCC1 family protein
MKLTRFAQCLLAGAATLAAITCADPPLSVPPPVARVVVTPTADTIQPARPLQLTATPEDEQGNPLSRRTVVWSTSNVAIATVTPEGVVTGRTEGVVQVRATVEDVVGSATITVRIVVASVSLTPAADTMTLGQTLQLTATPRDSAGQAVPNRPIAWSSANPGIATVSSAGVVTGQAEGAARIVATVQGLADTATVTVWTPAASLDVTPSADTIVVGTTRQMAATVRDAEGNQLLGRPITWSTPVPGIVGVSLTGLVTANAQGIATVRASFEGVSDTATIAVKTTTPVASVDVSPTGDSLLIGETRQLTATPKDAAGAALIGRRVAWSSSDPSVATVSASGLLTAVSQGAVTVTATVEGIAGTATAEAIRLDLTGEWVLTRDLSYYSQCQDRGSLYLTNNGSQFTGTAGHDGCNGYVIATFTGGQLTGRDFSFSAGDADYLGTVSANGTLGGTWCLYGDCYYYYGPWQAVRAGPVVSLAVAPSARTLVVGGSFQLKGTPRDAAGNALLAHPMVWTSDNASAVTVSSQGLVLAVGQGTATVTAAAEGLSATASIAATVVSFTSVTTGAYHSCGLAADGSAYCWGYNGDGELGDSTYGSSNTPLPVSGGLQFTVLSAGDYHTCGLVAGGAAYCWGAGNNGQLGNGSFDNRTAPVPVASGLSFASLSAGGSMTCGLTSAGAAYCWGNNSSGQLGDGSTTSRSTPVAVTGGQTFTALSAGGNHVCAIATGGAAWCWGGNGAGQLGNGTTAFQSAPTAVSGALTFASVTAGGSGAAQAHSCGVTAAGAAHCWGNGGSGQLGDGSSSAANRLTPTPVGGAISFASLEAGSDHTCGWTTGGAAYCWGSSWSGRLGNGTSGGTPMVLPAAVFGGLSFSSVSAGAAHTCATVAASGAYCWGSNGSGQIGNAGNSDYAVPVRVVGQP